jgi:energy-coupling factor transport system permease protein
MLTEYIPGNSFLHNLDVRTKLIWFTVLIGMVFMFDHPLFSALGAVFVITLFRAAALPLSGVKHLLAMFTPIAVILFLMTAFTNEPARFVQAANKHVVFSLFPNQTAALTTGGIWLGITIVSRIGVMMVGSVLLTYTTPLDDGVHFARKLHIPPTVIFIITTALRFIPTMERNAAMILDAQRARGADFENGGFVQRIRTYGWMMIPMIVDTIRMSENLAAAMVNRGFGAKRRVTVLDDIRMKPVDGIAIFLACVVLSGCIVLRINNIGQL